MTPNDESPRPTAPSSAQTLAEPIERRVLRAVQSTDWLRILAIAQELDCVPFDRFEPALAIEEDWRAVLEAVFTAVLAAVSAPPEPPAGPVPPETLRANAEILRHRARTNEWGWASAKVEELVGVARWLDEAAAALATAAPPAQEAEEWWCPECRTVLEGEQVTYEQTHDERCGGCGYRVVLRTPEARADAPSVRFTAPVAGTYRVTFGDEITIQCMSEWAAAPQGEPERSTRRQPVYVCPDCEKGPFGSYLAYMNHDCIAPEAAAPQTQEEG